MECNAIDPSYITSFVHTDLNGSFHLEEHSQYTNKYRTEAARQRSREAADYSSDSDVNAPDTPARPVSAASPHKQSDVIFVNSGSRSHKPFSNYQMNSAYNGYRFVNCYVLA